MSVVLPLDGGFARGGGRGRGERYVEGGSSLANTAVVGIGDAWQWYGGALEAGGRGRRGPYQHFTCPGAHAAVVPKVGQPWSCVV